MALDDTDWEVLLDSIKSGECTPFLGAAINDGILPLGGDVAKAWAKDYEYPLDTSTDLAKVAQYLAVTREAMWPKLQIIRYLNEQRKPFDFNAADEPLNVLAQLPFPVYLTTNYDDLLYQAINHHGRQTQRKAEFAVCKWNALVEENTNLFGRKSKFTPTPSTPLIYHLHGHQQDRNSLVLTEDDYLDFLVNMSRADKFLPPRIQEAITGSSVLFMGYSLNDINFRVMFRGLLGTIERALGRMSVAVQLPYKDGYPSKAAAEAYVSKYFSKLTTEGVRVYWGTAKEFAADLRKKWSDVNGRP